MLETYKEGIPINNDEKFTYKICRSKQKGYSDEVMENGRFFEAFLSLSSEQMDEISDLVARFKEIFVDCPGTRIHSISHLEEFIGRIFSIIENFHTEELEETITNCLKIIEFLSSKDSNVFQPFQNNILKLIEVLDPDKPSYVVNFDQIASIVSNLSSNSTFKSFVVDDYIKVFIDFLNIMSNYDPTEYSIFNNVLVCFKNVVSSYSLTDCGVIEDTVDSITRSVQKIAEDGNTETIDLILSYILVLSERPANFLMLYTHEVFDYLFLIKDFLLANKLYTFLDIINNFLSIDCDILDEKLVESISSKVDANELIEITKAEEEFVHFQRLVDLISTIILNKIILEDTIGNIDNILEVVAFCKRFVEDGSISVKKGVSLLYLEIMKNVEGEDYWNLIDEELIEFILQGISQRSKHVLKEAIKFSRNLVKKITVEPERCGNFVGLLTEFQNETDSNQFDLSDEENKMMDEIADFITEED